MTLETLTLCRPMLMCVRETVTYNKKYRFDLGSISDMKLPKSLEFFYMLRMIKVSFVMLIK